MDGVAVFREEVFAATDEEIAPDHGGGIENNEHGNLVEVFNGGGESDEAVDGVEESVAKSGEVNERPADSSPPDPGGADFGDAVLADGEFEERKPVEVGFGGDEALRDEMNFGFGARFDTVGEDVIIGESMLPEAVKAKTVEIFARDGHGAAPGKGAAIGPEECGDLGVEDRDNFVGGVVGHRDVVPIAGSGANFIASERGDKCPEPLSVGFGIGVHEGKELIVVGGAFDGGKLVVHFLATAGGEAGDDDFDTAIFGGDFFEEGDDGVFIGFDGEDEAIVGIILIEEGLDIGVGVIINALDGEDDGDARRVFRAIDGAGGDAGQAHTEALGDPHGPDRQHKCGSPDPE